jgi:fimbrial chaperone protein
MARAAEAQTLSVLPVNVFLAPGQRAATLTVTNQGTSAAAIQIRGFAWGQKDGDDELTHSDALVVSPPLASIAPGASRVVRIMLRQAPVTQEATYRILVDQIPAAAEPGIVRIVVRLSIPVFALPATRALPHVQFHLEYKDGKVFLVGVNDGLRHEVIREIVLSTSDGRKLKEDSGALPYILAGSTRRWAMVANGPLPLQDETLHLTARSEAGAIEEQVRVGTQ